MTPTLTAIGWLASGSLNAGLVYAFFQREFPSLAESDRTADTRFAWFVFAAGPLGLLPTFLCRHYRHGWLFPGRKAL